MKAPLGFKLEYGTRDAPGDVIVFDVGGRRPATAPESVLWARLEADARALWAVRVLDTWVDRNRSKLPPVPVPNPADGGWAVFVLGQAFQGDDPDAARIAAATALVAADPSLDPDGVRT